LLAPSLQLEVKIGALKLGSLFYFSRKESQILRERKVFAKANTYNL
jgi:hypothetical protein